MEKWIPDSMLVEDTQPQMPFCICYKQSTRPLILVTLQLVYFLLNSVKCFDRIDHIILFTELRKLGVSEIILGWISAFLVDRRQAVSVGGTLSKWNTLRGGIPQGTKLGVVLFAVMTNSLLVDWHLRTKFVDDASAVEILPRNSISLLNMAVSTIHNFAVTLTAETYKDALNLAGLEILASRRTRLCEKYMNKCVITKTI